jgi:hypothetical protein
MTVPLRAGFRFGVLSHVLPPAPTGQAMVLYRLLRDLPAEDYVLFSRQKYDGSAGSSTEPSASRRLPGRYVHLPRHAYFREWGPRALQRAVSMANNSLRARVRLLHVQCGDCVEPEKECRCGSCW